MSWVSESLRNRMVDFLWRGQAITLGGQTATWGAPPTYYVGLLSVVGSDAGGETELSGTGYARVALPAALTLFNATQGGTSGASSGTDGETENASVIQFPTVGAGGWGVAVGLGVYEAASGGLPIMAKALSTARPMAEGDTPRFSIAALSVSINKGI